MDAAYQGAYDKGGDPAFIRGKIVSDTGGSLLRYRLWQWQHFRGNGNVVAGDPDRFGLKNVQVVQGMAPEGMEDFPEPTHAFIGGSRGNMAAILKSLYTKNPSMRVVINAISLETLSEIMGCLKTWKVTDLDITQVQISKAKTLGDYHMMMGQNPVTIVSFQFTSN